MNLDLLQSLTKQLDGMGSFGAGYSAGSGIPEVAVLGGRGVPVPLVARNPVNRNSGANVSGRVLPAESLDRKHLCRPLKFLVRKGVVRSHHNLRRLITKETALEMRCS